jgi:trigger factor
MEGIDLNSTEITDDVTTTETAHEETNLQGGADAPGEHSHEQGEHSHEQGDHSHELSDGSQAHSEHSHEHRHGPSLNPELAREIEVEAPAEEVSKAFRAVVKRYQKLARIPGFRAGKVPESLVRSKFAKEVRQEVMESLVSQKFRNAITERKLRPISEPQLLDLMLVDGQALRFKAAFEVLPEFDVSGYESVKVEKPVTELGDEEFQSELTRALEGYSTVEPVEEDRPLVDGDWAEIQFRGEIKPLAQTVTEEGVTAASPSDPIVGDDILIEIGGKDTLAAFNEALRGAKVGQELTFEVEYPANFGQPKLAGQTVAYDVTVKAIKRKTFPERDEELAKQLGNYTSWEDFEKQFRFTTEARKREAVMMNARNKMLDEVIDRYHFPVPETFVQQQVDARLERGLRALAQQGMSSDDMRKLDFARLREAQRAEAEREVRASLVLDRIADVEQVTVAETEIDNELMLLSMRSGEPLETVRERMKQDGGLERLREQLRRERTGMVLYEKLAS